MTLELLRVGGDVVQARGDDARDHRDDDDVLPLLAVVSRRWLWATVALSIGALINLHAILTIDLYATPNLTNLPLHREVTDLGISS